MLNLTNDETMRSACAETVGRYGLGSCSPRGFYGTFQPHVDLENKIAEFLSVGEAVLYSFGACTASSAIQSLTHKSDVAVVDRAVGPAILAGLRLAKLEVRWCDRSGCGEFLWQCLPRLKRKMGTRPRGWRNRSEDDG